MYCIKCGKQISDNSSFCQHCGKEILNNEKMDTTENEFFIGYINPYTERMIESKEDYAEYRRSYEEEEERLSRENSQMINEITHEENVKKIMSDLEEHNRITREKYEEEQAYKEAKKIARYNQHGLFLKFFSNKRNAIIGVVLFYVAFLFIYVSTQPAGGDSSILSQDNLFKIILDIICFYGVVSYLFFYFEVRDEKRFPIFDYTFPVIITLVYSLLFLVGWTGFEGALFYTVIGMGLGNLAFSCLTSKDTNNLNSMIAGIVCGILVAIFFLMYFYIT